MASSTACGFAECEAESKHSVRGFVVIVIVGLCAWPSGVQSSFVINSHVKRRKVASDPLGVVHNI